MKELIEEIKTQIISALNLEDMTPADIDDNALLREAADKPRVEEVVGPRVGRQREDKPVGAPKKWAGDFFSC